jgi:hypothetical protein
VLCDEIKDKISIFETIEELLLIKVHQKVKLFIEKCSARITLGQLQIHCSNYIRNVWTFLNNTLKQGDYIEK